MAPEFALDMQFRIADNIAFTLAQSGLLMVHPAALPLLVAAAPELVGVLLILFLVVYVSTQPSKRDANFVWGCYCRTFASW